MSQQTFFGALRVYTRLKSICLYAAFCVLFGLVFSGAATSVVAQSATEAVQTEGTIAVGDEAIGDDEILRRIQKLLAEIDGYEDVSVAVSSGVVRLTGEVIDNVTQDRLTQIINRVIGVVAIENETSVSGTLEERLTPAMERVSARLRNLVANGPIFLVALAAFALIASGGWFLTGRIGIWGRLAPNAFIADVYRTVARIFFILVGLVLALDILNATALIGAVLGAAGVAGLALGFAVRDTVENFIASILLSLRQPFRPNDFVDIQGDQGTVARLTSRATILISPEGNHIRIPNATVFKGRIVNFTRDPNRRFDFDLGVDAEADLAAALTTGVAALETLAFVLDDPEVGAWISNVGDSNVVLTFTGWVNQNEVNFAKARGEAIRATKVALESAGFGLPEPIYRVRLDNATWPAQPQSSAAEAPKKRQKTISTLPDAADPARAELASADVAKRERESDDSPENLLDARQQTE
ncbi:mechanosensitive ion channel family protein [Cognatishimia maritima]|uniref:Small-conductance mechanosensitive channel n=1 Tax=Cognatishimia maritima TaxID=870908 RepID=A0A1M5PL55_9RHOB|nr:mechanosensitive ion channel domain-containing protein [Cognatishimia maritima]SHH02506.1 Small-conductance mechanosensitive channel [Cognatishimia maritima]